MESVVKNTLELFIELVLHNEVGLDPSETDACNYGRGYFGEQAQ
jgi:hypothetical protein